LISIPCICSHIHITSTRPLTNAGRTKVEQRPWALGSACGRAYLLLDAERVDVAEGDVPGVEPVGVVGARQQEQRREEDDEDAGRRRGGGLHSSPHLALHYYRCELSLLDLILAGGQEETARAAGVKQCQRGREGGRKRGPGRSAAARGGWSHGGEYK
jgi:hypothetical protein